LADCWYSKLKNQKKKSGVFFPFILFCSELVAEAYQRMDLLSEKKLSSEYTPKDFSDKSKLKLMKGKLHEEVAVRV
jgi:hypothetical protein